MKFFSSEEERRELLSRLRSAPKTKEIQVAIKIVEESIEYAELRKLVPPIYEASNNGATSDTFEDIMSQGWVHHEMRPFIHRVDELYREIRKERFKDLFVNQDDYFDEDGYKVI